MYAEYDSYNFYICTGEDIFLKIDNKESSVAY